MSNSTERLQQKFRNYRTRDLFGSYPFDPHLEPRRIVEGTPIRVKGHDAIADRTKQILDRLAELTAQGKSAAEALADVGLPSHSILPDTME